MIPSAQDAVVLMAMTMNGLLAGVYLAFSVAVSPALRRLDAGTHVRAFTSVNRVIINPVFLALFFGAPTLAAMAAIMTLSSSTGFLTLIATMFSLVGFVITVAVNVPLNRALEASDALHEVQARIARDRFSDRWDRANVVRTAACLATVLTLAWTAVSS